MGIHTTSRTLRAEIDLPNPGSQLLPGMYAYAEMVIERPKIWAVPLAALNFRGDQSFCWIHENGRAKRIEVQRGVSDDEWIEVTKRRVPGPPGRLAAKISWTPIDGSEEVIVGDTSILTDTHRCGSSRRWPARTARNLSRSRLAIERVLADGGLGPERTGWAGHSRARLGCRSRIQERPARDRRGPLSRRRWADDHASK